MHHHQKLNAKPTYTPNDLDSLTFLQIKILQNSNNFAPKILIRHNFQLSKILLFQENKQNNYTFCIIVNNIGENYIRAIGVQEGSRKWEIENSHNHSFSHKRRICHKLIIGIKSLEVFESQKHNKNSGEIIKRPETARKYK